MSLRAWALGFCAGAALASYLTLSCAVGHTQSVPDLIDQAAARYGAPEWVRQRARAVIWCESRYLNVANYRGSGAIGPAQFMPSTFLANRASAGFPDGWIWDPVANVGTALYMMTRGWWSPWAACLR